MEFEKMLKQLLEAKGTKPGERYQRSMESEGPSGFASSPVGKSNYNPEERVNDRKDPADQGNKIFTDIYRILSMGIGLLKNDDVYDIQMKGIMNGFKKSRKQISIDQERVLKNHQRYIDKAEGKIQDLTKKILALKGPNIMDIGEVKGKGKNKKVVNTSYEGSKNLSNPDLFYEYDEDLRATREIQAQYEKELEDVRNQIEDIIGQNEKSNNEYLEQLMVVMKHAVNRLYEKYNTPESSEPQQFSQTIPLHELDVEMLQTKIKEDRETQMQLLEMLMSEDDSINPLLKFFELAEVRYDDMKDHAHALRNGDNYNVSVERLFNALPLFQFINYFYSVILKGAPIKLNNSQKTTMDKNAGILTKLKNINSEVQFDAIKDEVKEFIKKSPVSDSQKQMLIGLADGKFITRKGAPNAAKKIHSSLSTSLQTESFDDFAVSILEQYAFDQDDYILDLMEIEEYRKK